VPKLKPEELESRKREIIDAARVCFLRSGFHQTTTDEICREASITPGGLYHYFASKEDIITAVIKQSASDVVSRLHEMLEKQKDAQSAYREVGSFFLEAIYGPDINNVTRLDLEIFAEATKNPKLAEISKEAWALRREWLETLIRRGMAEGVYSSSEFSTKGLSSLLIAVLLGMRLGKLLWDDEFDLEGAIEALYGMQTGKIIVDLPDADVPTATPARRSASGEPIGR
jgi:AcrR family transcriptional regulator